MITLVIIGVIASMTIPTLIASYNKHVAEVRLKKFYSSINQAIRKSEIDNGDKRYWDELNFDTQKEWYDKYLAPYIATAKVVYTDIIIMYFADGSAAHLSPYGIAYFLRGKDAENPYNIQGKTYFSFHFLTNCTHEYCKYHYNKGIEPYTYAWDGTRDSLFNDSLYGCKSTGGAYCTMLIALNHWHVPDDYPISFY